MTKSGKQLAMEWVLEHCDGKGYTTKQIGDQIGASPAVVRGAIRELHENGHIFAKNAFGGRNSEWKFWEDSPPTGDATVGPDSLREMFLL